MEKKNVYLFCGEDTWSASQKARFWKKEFEKKYGDYNVHSLAGEDLKGNEIWMAIETMPFLSDKKFILLNDFLRDGEDEQQKILAEKIESVPDFCILLFLETEKPDARKTLFKKLKNLAQVNEFPLLVGTQLKNWIEQSANKHKLNIGYTEINFLIENIGPNLWQLNSEIEKMSNYANGSPLNLETIEQLISPNITSSIFKLTDAIGEKNVKKAINIFTTLNESNEDLMMILFMLVRHFRLLNQARHCLDQKIDRKLIAKKMKEQPFVVNTAINQSANFPAPLLKKIHQSLLKIDSDIKGGGIKLAANDNSELARTLEKLMVRLCKI